VLPISWSRSGEVRAPVAPRVCHSDHRTYEGCQPPWGRAGRGDTCCRAMGFLRRIHDDFGCHCDGNRARSVAENFFASDLSVPGPCVCRLRNLRGMSVQWHLLLFCHHLCLPCCRGHCSRRVLGQEAWRTWRERRPLVNLVRAGTSPGGNTGECQRIRLVAYRGPKVVSPRRWENIRNTPAPFRKAK
jgi:hypothetical protein